MPPYQKHKLAKKYPETLFSTKKPRSSGKTSNMATLHTTCVFTDRMASLAVDWSTTWENSLTWD